MIMRRTQTDALTGNNEKVVGPHTMVVNVKYMALKINCKKMMKFKLT